MKKELMSFFLLGALGQVACAGVMGPPPELPAWRYVASVNVGPVWASSSEQQTIYFTHDVVRTYTPGVSDQTIADGELFLGFQTPLSPTLAGQLGLEVAAATNTTFSGVVWDDADPMFNNFLYSYQIQHTHLAAKGKLLYDRGFVLIPWVSASLGIAWNDLSGFNTTPVIFEALPIDNFQSNSSTAFTYTAAAGVQYAFNMNWQVGLSYEFADWGRSLFQDTHNQTFNDVFTVNHVYTNGLMFNITYLA